MKKYVVVLKCDEDEFDEIYKHILSILPSRGFRKSPLLGRLLIPLLKWCY